MLWLLGPALIAFEASDPPPFPFFPPLLWRPLGLAFPSACLLFLAGFGSALDLALVLSLACSPFGVSPTSFALAFEPTCRGTWF
jgi:hypothetical protein